MRKSFIERLCAEASINKNIWLLTADLGYSFLEEFEKRFPGRYVNVGVAEQNMMSIAAGLAMMGKKVFVYSIINFATFRALEQIRQDICYPALDVTIVGVGTGFSYAASGYAHYGIEDIAIMKAFFRMNIYSPADKEEVGVVMEEIFQRKAPNYLRLGKESLACLYPKKKEKGPFPVQEGVDCVLFATGSALKYCIEAISEIKYSVQLWSFPCIKPLDREFLREIVQKTPYLVTVEEHGSYGFSSLVLESLCEGKISFCFQKVELDTHAIHLGGNQEESNRRAGLSRDSIARAIHHCLHQDSYRIEQKIMK